MTVQLRCDVCTNQFSADNFPPPGERAYCYWCKKNHQQQQIKVSAPSLQYATCEPEDNLPIPLTKLKPIELKPEDIDDGWL